MPQAELRHCVVALDEVGNTIQHIGLRPYRPCQRIRYRDRKVWTDDWEEATSLCGWLTHNLVVGTTRLHPNDRRNEPAVLVGGYEVVSELMERE